MNRIKISNPAATPTAYAYAVGYAPRGFANEVALAIFASRDDAAAFSADIERETGRAWAADLGREATERLIRRAVRYGDPDGRPYADRRAWALDDLREAQIVEGENEAFNSLLLA